MAPPAGTVSLTRSVGAVRGTGVWMRDDARIGGGEGHRKLDMAWTAGGISVGRGDRWESAMGVVLRMVTTGGDRGFRMGCRSGVGLYLLFETTARLWGATESTVAVE